MTALRDRNLPASSKRRGFAIVMALSLLSIVFLLVISLVNLVGTDLSLADSRKEKVLAQAHARMGMMVAIGEIQKHLGPDTRVSTTADILDERIESGRQFETDYYTENSSASLGQAVANNQAIDLNENNQLDTVPFGQRYWTGVWKHRARRKGVTDDHRAAAPLPKNLETGATMTSTPMSDTEYDPHPAVELAWLVSGNEGWTKKLGFLSGQLLREYVEIPDGIPSDDQQRYILEGGIYGQAENAWLDYQSALENNLEDYGHPLIDLLDPDDEGSDTVWILRRPLLEEPISEEDEESGQWRSKLRGEPVKVKKTDILPDDPDDRLHTHGSYAYWVGDEGVKTKLNVSVPANDDTIGIQPEDDLALAKKPNTSFPGLSVGGGTPGEGGFGLEFSDNSASSKTLTLGSVTEENILKGDTENNRKKVAAHYHSLSPDSHGVLADVRTGGLKRDLSHVFANVRDWDETLEDATYNWLDDFLGFIYRERIHVLKSVPLEPNAKANQWNDTAATESINDYKGILAGPLWRTLGSFHNLYLKLTIGGDRINNLPADALPRFSGDNMVIFDPKNGRPEARGRPYWTQTQGNPMLAINTRLNWFRESNARPGPKSHPIQPVLVEYKFSQVPTLSGGNLALAMYPSIALWNPYNVAITMNQLFVEIPMKQSTLNSMNPKEYDRWRKWTMWKWLPTKNSGGGGSIPNIPSGFPFGGRGPVGINGVMGLPGALGFSLIGHHGRPEPRLSYEDFFKYGPSRYSYTPRTSPHQYVIDPDLAEYRKRFHFLFSNDPVDPSTNLPSRKKERHLLLSIRSLILQPGEKAHFVVSPGQKSQWAPLPADGSPRQYLQVPLMKGFDEHPFMCETPLAISVTEPLTVQNIIGKIHGVHPSQLSFYNPINAKMLDSFNYPESKGITMYSEDPTSRAIATNLYEALPPSERKPIFKITKSFDINAGHGQWNAMMNPSVALQESTLGLSPDFLPGNGIRIRFKLPGTADRITLEQYNLRALVQSYQDGFGDNWRMENFVGSRYLGENFNYFQRLVAPLPSYVVVSDDPDEPTQVLGPHTSRFADFYEFAANGHFDENMTIDQAILPLDPPNFSNLEDVIKNNINDLSPFDIQIVPRITFASSSIGYFHDLDEVHGAEMQPEENAVLFEVPTSPMLSVLQFRHANLNDYSHGPTYALGNSYATPQVARYKTWGRVKAISWDPEGGITFDIPNNESASQQWKQAFQVSTSPWEWFIAEFNLYMPSLAPVRNVDAQNEHQNTTLDHSYYANRALLDGFLMSGVGHGEWAPKTPEQLKQKHETLEPGQRLYSFRNPRLLTYMRDNDLPETSYGDLSDDVLTTDEASFRFQTLASDLLLDGAFNINSTSVDAWISHLTALKGKTVPTASGSYPSTVTTVPRFLNVPEQNSWNKIASLTDDEVVLLAYCLVEQIKLRGPFLSFADFTNRRIIGTPVNLIPHRITDWGNKAQETRDSILGLRGAVQAAIAEAKLNSSNSGTSSPENPFIPTIPDRRFTGSKLVASPFLPPSQMNFISSEFGLPAFCSFPPKGSRPGDPFAQYKILSQPEYLSHTYANFEPQQELSYVSMTSELGQGITEVDNFFVGVEDQNGVKVRTGNIRWGGQTFSFKAGWEDYEGSASFGEAPDNLLAVEDASTAANKPGWIMQSDLLSPLAPVTSARSDTFVIRVMGENKAFSERKTKGRAWIELTVQRTPDYVKPYLDAPHHRPHEPFEDRNFNGYWDNDPSFREHWLDLNLNGMDDQGQQTEDDAQPDLPAEGIYPDGLGSDLPLNLDPEEEPPGTVISTMGINQRFGRKFKIIKFRWIKEQDV